VVITDMQLDDLSRTERRGFILAYRSVLKTMIDVAGGNRRSEIYAARAWALVCVIVGAGVGILLDHVIGR
jgi:hypothetical protein